ncbi:hypothetical protein [Streptomyces sp. NPDC056304]
MRETTEDFTVHADSLARAGLRTGRAMRKRRVLASLVVGVAAIAMRF